MQNNNPVHSLTENFALMTVEELEVLLQKVDSEQLAVLSRLSEARPMIQALQEEEAALALEVKLDLIELDKKAWGLVRGFLKMFATIIAAMPPATDPAHQAATTVALQIFSKVREHMEAADKQRAVLEATLANLRRD